VHKRDEKKSPPPQRFAPPEYVEKPSAKTYKIKRSRNRSERLGGGTLDKLQFLPSIYNSSATNQKSPFPNKTVDIDSPKMSINDQQAAKYQTTSHILEIGRKSLPVNSQSATLGDKAHLDRKRFSNFVQQQNTEPANTHAEKVNSVERLNDIYRSQSPRRSPMDMNRTFNRESKMSLNKTRP
jgi:hypothetical protein